MFRIVAACVGLILLLTPSPSPAAPTDAFMEKAQADIQGVLEKMSSQLNRFEEIQRRLDRSGRNNAAYDEEKNMWISAILAVTTIAAVCEYENDLLSLFLDLKPKRRPYFHDVRIQSLNSSIHQIKIMKEQIRINYQLISIRSEEKDLFEEINRTIDASVFLLTDSLRAVTEMKESSER
jgi:hypothetical protein